ncbi:MFS transporter [Actinocorallia sp. API 0066]|uniref:MFS transporter n=1 Tax=Actinocorallia sp. API 0066 TaxID=2896846 RepID=UPI001E5D272E|nr:MFS transporter [Actinocorallia sp. API 0066]MCD0447769.1 MFS transporter [Actinocorallia sp. API 0066]
MRTPHRWAMLTLGMAANGAASVFIYGLPFLLPAFQDERGLSLARAGFLVGAPSLGMLFTLILWGWLADRFGERLVLTSGLLLAGLLLGAAALARDTVLLGVLLVLAGAAGASVNAASGRVVLGWFAKEQRGLAMGLRQTALPLGVAFAGLLTGVFPQVRAALLAMAALCLVTALVVGLLVVDPPRPEAAPGARASSPYRAAALWRVHTASMLLVVPQFATSAFALVYLLAERDLPPATAGALVSGAQVLGAAGRLACGRWSDVVGSRLRPMRQLALVNTVVMLLLAVAAATPWGVPLVVVATALAMSGNGLAFTAVSELAGAAWAGRAMGVQNTGQNLVVALTPGFFGALITSTSYAAAYALAGLCALAAATMTPSEPTTATAPAPSR